MSKAREIELDSGTVGFIDDSADGICSCCVRSIAEAIEAEVRVVPVFHVDSQVIDSEQGESFDVTVLTVLASDFTLGTAKLVVSLHALTNGDITLCIDTGKGTALAVAGSGETFTGESNDLAQELIDDELARFWGEEG